MDREHDMFGFDLGGIPTRMDRLGEGLQVITSLLRTDKPVSFSGQCFQLRDAALPGPSRPTRPPILVGASGPKRGLPLVAHYADIWNTQGLTPEEVRVRSSKLDALLTAAGRQPGDVRRSFNAPIVCGRTPAELEDRLRGFRRIEELANLPVESLLSALREWFPAPFFGTPDEVVDQIRAYERVGITEVTLQWFDTEDVEGLEVLAHEILPRFPATHD